MKPTLRELIHVLAERAVSNLDRVILTEAASNPRLIARARTRLQRLRREAREQQQQTDAAT